MVGLFHQLDRKISVAFLTPDPAPRPLALGDTPRRLAPRSLLGTPEHPHSHPLIDHLHQAPAGLPEGAAADAAETITVELMALLRNLREQITALETRIAHALATHADAAEFTRLPRSGTVRAATLLAEIGDARGRFPTDGALAAAAGIAPPPRLRRGPPRRVPRRRQPPPPTGLGRRR